MASYFIARRRRSFMRHGSGYFIALTPLDKGFLLFYAFLPASPSPPHDISARSADARHCFMRDRPSSSLDIAPRCRATITSLDALQAKES